MIIQHGASTFLITLGVAIVLLITGVAFIRIAKGKNIKNFGCAIIIGCFLATIFMFHLCFSNVKSKQIVNVKPFIDSKINNNISDIKKIVEYLKKDKNKLFDELTLYKNKENINGFKEIYEANYLNYGIRIYLFYNVNDAREFYKFNRRMYSYLGILKDDGEVDNRIFITYINNVRSRWGEGSELLYNYSSVVEFQKYNVVVEINGYSDKKVNKEQDNFIKLVSEKLFNK